jgi:cell volume regulation protein A
MGEAPLHVVLLGGAIFLLVSVLASKASAKLGIPALAVFLLIGMLAGSDGFGGIYFNDIGLAQTLGSVALGLILFAGGLDAPWRDLKPVAWRALSLSTVGVAVTAGLVGLFAYWLMGLPIKQALLLGAVVSSTDAAAVFGVLRTRGVQLKNKLTPMLEAESGSNDAAAVFLTLGLITLIGGENSSVFGLVPAFLLQMPLGLAVGWACGNAAVILINKIRLEYDGLYNVVTLAIAALAFGGAKLAGGNEFLAVYVAGVTMSGRNFLHKLALIQFHDGLAWLMQISMFVVLGLLVFPSQLWPLAPFGILLSFFLMFVARPVAVFTSLAFTKNLRKRDKLFASWAGLRGAVPIVLATFPVSAGIEGANIIFNLVFFIVLSSVVIQGTTLRRVGKLLEVVEEKPQELSDAKTAERPYLLEFTIRPHTIADGKAVVDLNLPSSALMLMLKRDDKTYIPKGATMMKAGDVVLMATRREDHDEIGLLFEGLKPPRAKLPDDDMVIG